MSASDASPRLPHDVAGWMRGLDVASLPVLAETAEAIETLRAIEDEVDAHLLAEVITPDPLMSLKLMAHVASLRRHREVADPETVTAALVLLGIGPFFRAFGPQRAVEQVLGDQPVALAGFRRVLRRSHRAANFASAIAVHRMDHDVAVIQEAALLHDFAELLLWLQAPQAMAGIAAAQRADPTLRSAEVQRAVLGIEIADLQHALMKAWRLPPLLVHLADDHGRADAQALTARLGMRVARHTADDWDNPALPDDIEAIGHLLRLGPEATLRLLHDADA